MEMGEMGVFCMFYIWFYRQNLTYQSCIFRNTATKYLNALEDAGILISEHVGKEKIFKNVFLFELLK